MTFQYHFPPCHVPSAPEVHVQPRVALVDAPRSPRTPVTDAALDAVLRNPLRRLGLRTVPRVADDLGVGVASAVEYRGAQVRGVPGVVWSELARDVRLVELLARVAELLGPDVVGHHRDVLRALGVRTLHAVVDDVVPAPREHLAEREGLLREGARGELGGGLGVGDAEDVDSHLGFFGRKMVGRLRNWRCLNVSRWSLAPVKCDLVAGPVTLPELKFSLASQIERWRPEIDWSILTPSDLTIDHPVWMVSTETTCLPLVVNFARSS